MVQNPFFLQFSVLSSSKLPKTFTVFHGGLFNKLIALKLFSKLLQYHSSVEAGEGSERGLSSDVTRAYSKLLYY